MSSEQTPCALAANTTTRPWKVQMGARESVSCVPRVLSGSAGAAPLILMMFFRSVPSISDHSVSQACIECEQIFEMPHLSNKKFVLYWHSKRSYVFMKTYFGIRDERIVAQNDQMRQHEKDIFRTNFSETSEKIVKFSLLRCTPRARKYKGARNYNGAIIMFQHSKAQTHWYMKNA